MEYIVDVIVVIKLYYLTEPPASINHHDWINTSIQRKGMVVLKITGSKV